MVVFQKRVDIYRFDISVAVAECEWKRYGLTSGEDDFFTQMLKTSVENVGNRHCSKSRCPVGPMLFQNAFFQPPSV